MVRLRLVTRARTVPHYYLPDGVRLPMDHRREAVMDFSAAVMGPARRLFHHEWCNGARSVAGRRRGVSRACARRRMGWRGPSPENNMQTWGSVHI